MHREKFEFFLERVASNKLVFERAKKIADGNWGIEISNKAPTFFPFGDFGLKFFKPVPKRVPYFNEGFDHIVSNSLFFPNVHGLVIIEQLDRINGFIPIETWILGLDHIHHLFFKAGSGHVVPYLKKNHQGLYEYGYFPWGSEIEQDEMIVAFHKV